MLILVVGLAEAELVDLKAGSQNSKGVHNELNTPQAGIAGGEFFVSENFELFNNIAPSELDDSNLPNHDSTDVQDGWDEAIDWYENLPTTLHLRSMGLISNHCRPTLSALLPDTVISPNAVPLPFDQTHIQRSPKAIITSSRRDPSIEGLPFQDMTLL